MASSNSFLPSPVAQEKRMPGTASQSGWIPRSHLFRISSRGAVRAAVGKASVQGAEASATSRTRSADSSALLVRVMPACSITSEDSRTPAVSISRRASPASWMDSSTVSRVVPAILLTMARSYPSRVFSRLDFPTLGGPAIAVRIPSRSRRPPSAVRSSPESFSSMLRSRASKPEAVSGEISSSGKSI
ncbi:unknown [Akkermansia sp. CAG:344]|nr:unknown [Akkermansia sp. CAG:344]